MMIVLYNTYYPITELPTVCRNNRWALLKLRFFGNVLSLFLSKNELRDFDNMVF